MGAMELHLLVIDRPPLVRDLVAKRILRGDGDGEGGFVDGPATAGDAHAISRAARATAPGASS
jgi:hypothetical protein